MAGGSAQQQVGIQAAIYLGLIVCGVIAWRNVTTGRADLRGATKLALFYGSCMLASRFLQAHHSANLDEATVFWKSISVSMINATAVWGFYAALEPWVRRKWPQVMITWSRFTTRGIRDPLVGRDLLLGAGFGCVGAAIALAAAQLSSATGHLLLPDLSALSGLRAVSGSALDVLTNSVFLPLFLFFLLFASRIVLRKPSLAIAAFILLMTALTGSTAEPWVAYPESFLVAIVTTILLLRFGLMAFMVAQAMAVFLVSMPRTFDGSQWYFGLGLAPLAIVAAVALFGFRTSLGGKTLWKGDLT